MSNQNHTDEFPQRRPYEGDDSLIDRTEAWQKRNPVVRTNKEPDMTTTNTSAVNLSDEQKKQIAAVVHRDCALIPGANFYTAAELAIKATLAQLSLRGLT